MKEGQVVAVWLHDAAARLFLGLRPGSVPSRWVVIGTVEGPALHRRASGST